MYIYSALPWQRTHQRPRTPVLVACPPCGGGPKERAKEAAPARDDRGAPGRATLPSAASSSASALPRTEPSRQHGALPGQPAGRAHASSAVAWGSQWSRSTLGNAPARPPARSLCALPQDAAPLLC